MPPHRFSNTGLSGLHIRPGFWILYFRFGSLRWQRRVKPKWTDHPDRSLIIIRPD